MTRNSAETAFALGRAEHVSTVYEYRCNGIGRSAAVAMLAFALLTACSAAASSPPRDAIGDPRAGKVVISRMACGSCHDMPGIEEADGKVGPPLAHFASRQIIAGALSNSPQELVRYLRSPQSVVKGNYMPDQGLSIAQADNVAAYLYTLK